MNPAFYIGPAYFLTFFGIISFINYSYTKENRKLTDKLLVIINNQVTETITGLKVESLVYGKKSSFARQLLFRRCDLYILPDAVCIATYSIFFGLKLVKRPILITQNNEAYEKFIVMDIMPTIQNINPDSFSKSVYLEYGFPHYDVEADIHIYGLTDTQRNYFRFAKT